MQDVEQHSTVFMSAQGWALGLRNDIFWGMAWDVGKVKPGTAT